LVDYYQERYHFTSATLENADVKARLEKLEKLMLAKDALVQKWGMSRGQSRVRHVY
jgi:hypothetical protein